MQKYLDPAIYQEFAIDFVSFNGRHYNSGVLEYQASLFDECPIRRYNQPRTVDELEGVSDLLNYVISILNALKVQSSFTHNEVFWNRRNHQFYLIESNNRMAGNGNNEIYRHFYGANSLDLMLKLVQGEHVESYTHKKIWNCIVMSVYNRFIDNATSINVDGLKSFKKYIHFRNKNKLEPDFYKKYTRADHISAGLLLKHKDKLILDKDIDEIINRELSGNLFGHEENDDE